MKAHTVVSCLLDAIKQKKGDPEDLEILVDAVRHSIKFKIDIDSVPEITPEQYQEIIKTIQLPFEVCYFEIPQIKTALVLGQPDDFRYIQMLPFFNFSSDKNQIFSLHAKMFLAIEREKEGRITTLTDDKKYIKEVEELFGERELMDVIFAAIYTVISGLNLLNCNNIELVDNPAPAALNKKRIKKGKLPIYEYKTIQIKPGKHYSNQSNGASDRSGPRFHLRRGHIRRLPSGNTTWVRHCAVGDPSRGKIEKDYSI